MLNPEQANEQLKAFRNENWKQQRIASIANLPEPLREVGWGILERDSFGQPQRDYQAGRDAQNTALKQLDALSTQERLAIFTELFPQIAAQVEQAWQLFTRLISQAGSAGHSAHPPRQRLPSQSAVTG